LESSVERREPVNATAALEMVKRSSHYE
jgi:hypothetical protein